MDANLGVEKAVVKKESQKSRQRRPSKSKMSNKENPNIPVQHNQSEMAHSRKVII